MSAGISLSLVLRTLIQLVQKSREGENRAALLGSEPDRGTFLPSIVSSPENDVNGTRQRVSGSRQRPRCALSHCGPRQDRARSSAAPGSRLACPLLQPLGGVHQNPPRARRQRAITSSSPRGIVRKNPRQQGQVAGPVIRRHPRIVGRYREGLFFCRTLASRKDQPYLRSARTSTRGHRLLTI